MEKIERKSKSVLHAGQAKPSVYHCANPNAARFSISGSASVARTWATTHRDEVIACEARGAKSRTYSACFRLGVQWTAASALRS